MKGHRSLILLFAVAGVSAASIAEAHVSISSGPATADTSNIVTFSVGHGCEGDDTFAIEVMIPAGVTSVRPMPSALGAITVNKDQTGAVTSVKWQKAELDDLDEDILYYEVKLRMRIPDAPFTTLYYVVNQTCRAEDGTLTVVEWSEIGEGGDGEPAAELAILPERQRGWNKFTVPAEMTELDAFFADALIVWKGTAAFSANPHTAEQIANTSGVTALTQLAAGDEIWVKY